MWARKKRVFPASRKELNLSRETHARCDFPRRRPRVRGAPLRDYPSFAGATCAASSGSRVLNRYCRGPSAVAAVTATPAFVFTRDIFSDNEKLSTTLPTSLRTTTRAAPVVLCRVTRNWPLPRSRHWGFSPSGLSYLRRAQRLSKAVVSSPSSAFRDGDALLLGHRVVFL